MKPRTLPNRLTETPLSLAERYIRGLGKLVARYERKVNPIDKRIAELEAELEKMRAKKEAAKPMISRLARRFKAFAERHRDDFLRGKSKLVKTPFGDFRWANNQRGILCSKEDEQPIVNEIIRVGRFDLFRSEVKRRETLAAVDNGELSSDVIPVGNRERFVIQPVGTLPITICGEDPVRIGKEEVSE